MSEETNEMQTNDAAIDSAEFEAKLTDFFTQHKESKLKLVPRIVEEFKGSESTVLEHLHNKYVLGIVTEKPKKKAATATPLSSEGEQHVATAAETKPKSKKKLMLIIVTAVVVIGLGVTGFMMKDKFFGKHEERAKTETVPAESQPAAEQPKEEAAPAATTQTDSVPAAATDSAGATEDTTQVQ